MTRETKIGLLVGMGFIICFGVILGEARSDKDLGSEDIADRGVPVPAASAHLTALRPAGPSARRAGPAREAPAERRSARPERSTVDTPAPTSGPPAPPPDPIRPAPRTYAVVAGDSLYRIAGKVYGAGNERHYKLIFDANRARLPSEASLQVGQKLIIPPLPSSPPAEAAPLRAGPGGATEPVSPGAAPSRVRELDERQLREYLRSVPAYRSPVSPRPGPAVAAGVRQYTVQRGDNLCGIARKMYNDDSSAAVQKLYAANRHKLGSPDCLWIGTVLLIPG